jgi:hypothetical protein
MSAYFLTFRNLCYSSTFLALVATRHVQALRFRDIRRLVHSATISFFCGTGAQGFLALRRALLPRLGAASHRISSV